MGIGRATAERLASEGAHVIVADVDETAGEATVAALSESKGKASLSESAHQKL
mgnify:CR=1 FL=1